MLIVGVTALLFVFYSLNVNAVDNSSPKIVQSSGQSELDSTLINGLIDRNTLAVVPTQQFVSKTTVISLNVSAVNCTVAFSLENSDYGTVSPTSITVESGTTFSANDNKIIFSDGQEAVVTPKEDDENWEYDFGGWNLATGVVTDPNTSLVAQIVRSSQPAPTYSYALMFNANGGDNAPAAVTYTGVEEEYEIQISAATPDKDNDNFEGWATTNDATDPEYQANDTVSLSKEDTDKTLYAVWSSHEYAEEENEGVVPNITIPDTGFFTESNGKIAANTSIIVAIFLSITIFIFRRRKARSHYNAKLDTSFYWIAGLVVLGVSYGLARAIQNSTTNAVDAENSTITMTLPSVVSLEAAQGEFVSNTLEFTVSTNNPTGYTVSGSLEGNNSKLVNTNDEDKYIPSVAMTMTESELRNSAAAAWGVTTDNSGNYFPFSNIKTQTVTGQATYNETYSFGVGVKTAVTTKSGTYQSAPINIIATTNVAYVDYALTYDLNGGEGDFPMQLEAVSAFDAEHSVTYTIATQIPTKAGSQFLGWDTDGTKISEPLYAYDATTGTLPGATIETTEPIETLYAIWTDLPTAKAILGENGNLNFVYDQNSYAIGDAYEDNLGTTTIAKIYSVSATNDNHDWNGWRSGSTEEYRSDITSANFDASFADFETTSLKNWFYYDGYISSITNLQNLKTSAVTTLENTFYNTGSQATNFNLAGINDWDTAQVTNMSHTFYGIGKQATTWNIGNLANWNTKNVTTMNSMFMVSGKNATSWSVGNLGSWNVAKVTDMANMFSGAGYASHNFNLGNLANWQVGNVTNMDQLFHNAGHDATQWQIGDLSDWNTAKVESMNELFAGAGYGATTWSIGDLSNWNLASAKTTRRMFYRAGYSAATWNVGNLGLWNTSNVLNMSAMFSYAGYNATEWYIGRLDGWDVSRVQTFGREYNSANAYSSNGMFEFAGYHAEEWNIGDLRSWNTTNATNLSGMFANTPAETLDLSGWNTTHVENMSGLFENCMKLEAIVVGDDWSMAAVTAGANMFKGDLNLVGGYGTVYDNTKIDKTYARVDRGEEEPGYFTHRSTYNYPTARAILGENGNLNFVYDNENYSVGGTYTDNLGETTIAIIYTVPTASYSLDQVPWSGKPGAEIDVKYRSDITSANFDESFLQFEPLSTAYWFYYDGFISTITNAQNINTKSVINMNSMFEQTGVAVPNFSITGLENWNTSHVTAMSGMFWATGAKATTWTIGDLGNWDTSKVTTMRGMFGYAGQKATNWTVGDLDGWNTQNVTDMHSMFLDAGEEATTWSIGDLSNWNVGKVTTMKYMFQNVALNALVWSIGDLSGWNTGKVTDMSHAFEYAGYKAQTFNLGNLDNWNLAKVTTTNSMFYGAGHDATVWNIGNLSGWNTSNVTDMGRMFDSAGRSGEYSLDLHTWNIESLTYYRGFRANVADKIIPPTWPTTDEPDEDIAIIEEEEIPVPIGNDDLNSDSAYAKPQQAYNNTGSTATKDETGEQILTLVIGAAVVIAAISVFAVVFARAMKDIE